MSMASSIRMHYLIESQIPNLSIFPTTKYHIRKISPFSLCSLKPLQISSSGETMATTPISLSEEVAHDFSPFLKIYKDGHIERLVGVDVVPPSLDPDTGVKSKDVVISPETGVSARLFIPNPDSGGHTKLPVVVYFHGGGFCVETPFCAKYHNAVKTLVIESNVVAVSVHYRLAPENPIPVPYEDSWAAVLWAAAHARGAGPDEWLNTRADFSRVYFAGDSAGANIAHNMALRVGSKGILSGLGVNLVGMILVHPYFWGVDPVGNEPVETAKRAMGDGIWRFAYPGTPAGSDDPWMNPAKDPELGKLGCKRILVCVAEKDGLRDRAWYYKEVLEKSGWTGTVEMLEAYGDDHVFHLNNPTCDNALALVKKIASFINEQT